MPENAPELPEEIPEYQAPPEPAPISDLPVPPLSEPIAHLAPLWGWRDLALFLPFAFLALFLANVLVVVGYMVMKGLAGRPYDLHEVQTNPVFVLVLQIILHALLFGFLYLLVVVYHRKPFWRSFKLRKPTRREVLAYIAAGLAVAIGVQLAPTLIPEKENFPLQQMFTSPQVALALGLFATLIAPFMEELIFRGFIFSIFERQVGMVFAIVGSAVLFAALHIPEYQGAWNHLLMIFLVGIVFSVVRGVTGSLTPSIIIHFAYNLSLMTLLFFATEHFRDLGFIWMR